MLELGDSLEEITDKVEKLDPQHNGRYLLDDKSDGLLFADITHEYARFNKTTNQYSVYNGICWIDDQSNLIVEGIAQKIVTAMYLLAADLDADDPYKKHVYRLGHYGARKTMLLEARNLHAISMEEMDQDKYLLNVQNGTIELRTLTFREHRAEDLLSNVANVNYDADATCPIFLRFIAEVTSSPDENGVLRADPDKADYLQRVLGYCLIGDVREDAFWLLYGSTTRNGKSTLLSVLGDILGGYAAMLEPDALAQNRRVNQNDEQIADLRGKRFAHVEEPSRSMALDTGLVKKLTGRSKLSASRKYEHRVEYFPEFTIVMATNWLPSVLDETLFKSGRVKVITFDRHFEDWEQDKDLRSKLRAEGPGILNWLLEGLRKYYERRIEPPKSVIDATDAYRQASDRIGNFLRDCTIEDEHGFSTLKQLYQRYTQWCDASGYNAEGKQKFIDALNRKMIHIIPHKKIKGAEFRNVILGITVEMDTSDFEPVTADQVPFTDYNN